MKGVIKINRFARRSSSTVWKVKRGDKLYTVYEYDKIGSQEEPSIAVYGGERDKRVRGVRLYTDIRYAIARYKAEEPC